MICHICNDLGGWGAGFVMAISKRWPQPEAAYRLWYHERGTNNFALGEIDIVEVAPKLWVVNMVAQQGFGRHDGVPPIRYAELERCLIKLNRAAKEKGASVHMPRIGCGIAGGKWSEVGPIVERTLEVPVYVYDFE
jgi:O-acetyl-ADP-ribose deacetylase (regulator of RNase III)